MSEVKRIEDMAPSFVEHPFMREYLEPLMELVRLVFIKFNENNNIDTCNLIDHFMSKNEARLGMDRGNPRYLNMGWKQVYNRTLEYMGNADKEKFKLDDIMLHYLADTYTYWQWAYNLPSKEICKRCPSKQLIKEYNPLHETGLASRCRKLTEKYFPEMQIGECVK